MFTIYKSGKNFLDENADILRSHPLETVFMEGNARALENCDCDNFAVKVWQEEAFLLAIERKGVPMRLWGSEALVGEMAEVLAKNDCNFGAVLGYPNICNGFLAEYERLCGGRHETKHSMEIMYCKNPKPCDSAGVRFATIADTPTLAKFFVDFLSEAVDEKHNIDDISKQVQDGIGDIALLEKEGIVSVAKRTQDAQSFCRLSYVYTAPAERNKGYSKKVVTFLTEKIVESGSVAYLFVDKKNPISNHLYRKIGYEYAVPQYEITYFKP